MKQLVDHALEMLIGAVIFTLGMMFLLSNERMLNRLIASVNASTIEEKDIYQQDYIPNINMVTSEELYAIVMVYREYPIFIDGETIEMDGTDYEYYVSLINSGKYSKSYNYNMEHEISSINYKYNGT